MKPLSFFKETFPYFKQTILTVRLKRAESPKAPSPGHRPGYNGSQQGALKGQKLYNITQPT